MKNISVTLLIFIMFLNFGTFEVDAGAVPNVTADIEKDDCVLFIKALNYMPECSYSSSCWSEKVTRAEYAQILCNINGIVLPENDKDYIKTAIENGLLDGSGYGALGKAMEVTLLDVIKPLISSMGYSKRSVQKKGMIDGYYITANELCMLRGIKSGINDSVSRWEIAKIIYNSINVEMLNTISVGDTLKYGTIKGHTLLSEIMGLNFLNGIVADNGITSLRSVSAIEKNNIQVGDTVLLLPEDKKFAADYIGRHVKVYYTNNDSEDIHTVKGIWLDENTDDITIMFENFDKLNQNVMSYYKDGKLNKAAIDKIPYIIYNGKAEDTLKAEFFEYENGSIIITSNESQYDTLIIEGYVSWYVAAIDKSRNLIYPNEESRSLQDGSRVLNIDSDENYISVFDNHMKEVGTGQIYSNTIIDICKNNNIIKIMLPDNVVFDAETQAITDNGIISSEKEYKILDYYKNADNAYIPDLTRKSRLFFNSFGYIVYAQIESYDGINTGYMCAAAKTSEVSSQCELKVLMSNGNLNVFKTTGKVVFIDEQGQKNNYSFDGIYSALKSYNGIFAYKVTQEGLMNYIELPAKKDVGRDSGRLGCIMENGGGYYNFTGHIGFKCTVSDTETRVFAINKNASDDEGRYKVYSPKQYGEGTWGNVNAYNFEPGSLHAEYILLSDASESDATVTKSWFMVTDIVKTIENDEHYLSVTGYYIGETVTKTTMKGKTEVFESMKDVARSGNVYDLTIGDIIWCASDIDNLIINAELLYRSDVKNTNNPNGRKGNFAGNLGYYSNVDKQRSNPFVPYTANDGREASTDTRIVGGYVYRKDMRGNLIYTTQDLSCQEYDIDYDADKYVTETRPAPTSFTAVTYRNGNVYVKNGLPDDIRTYEVVGNECSKILIQYRYSNMSSSTIIINGEI